MISAIVEHPVVLAFACMALGLIGATIVSVFSSQRSIWCYRTTCIVTAALALIGVIVMWMKPVQLTGHYDVLYLGMKYGLAVVVACFFIFGIWWGLKREQQERRRCNQSLGTSTTLISISAVGVLAVLLWFARDAIATQTMSAQTRLSARVMGGAPAKRWQQVQPVCEASGEILNVGNANAHDIEQCLTNAGVADGSIKVIQFNNTKPRLNTLPVYESVDMGYVETLSIDGTSLKDFSSLNQFYALRQLVISNCEGKRSRQQLAGLDQIVALDKLQSLTILGCQFETTSVLERYGDSISIDYEPGWIDSRNRLKPAATVKVSGIRPMTTGKPPKRDPLHKGSITRY